MEYVFISYNAKTNKLKYINNNTAPLTGNVVIFKIISETYDNNSPII